MINILIEQKSWYSTCSFVVRIEELLMGEFDDDESAPGVGGNAIDCVSKCLNCKPML